MEGNFTNFEWSDQMASTGKTANLKLSQWAAGDTFTCGDLNADFRAIDAAVAAAGARDGFVLLKDITMAASGSTLNLDTTDIKFTDWQFVFIDIISISTSCNVKLNEGMLSGSCAGLIGSSSPNGGYWGKASSGTRLVFSPCRANIRPSVISIGQNYLYYGSGDGSYGIINSVNFTLSSNLSFSGTAVIKSWGDR